MTLELRCGDVVPGCDGIVQGETRDAVMNRAAEHAASAHGLTTIDDDTRRALSSAIHETG